MGRRKRDYYHDCPWCYCPCPPVGGMGGGMPPGGGMPFMPDPCHVPISQCTNGICFDVNFLLIAVILIFCLGGIGPVKCCD